jgi:2-polyprenyl-3-methyl-5-hydroxy-6-metoxy-1,4-benzoquinol methylase
MRSKATRARRAMRAIPPQTQCDVWPKTLVLAVWRDFSHHAYKPQVCRKMTSASPSDAEFTGKYENAGRIASRLIAGFFDSARRLLQPHLAPGQTVLEIGCGAGYSTQRINAWQPGLRLIASDVGESLLAQASQRNPGVAMLRQSVYQLGHEDKSLDAVVMLEVLEHLEHPQNALAELHRVCRGHVLLSTPREPIWRVLNMARGKYLGGLGNTPGHIQHWSTRGLKREVSSYFSVIGQATPLPWTILLLRPRR